MKYYCHVDYNEFENPILEKLSKDIISFCSNKANKIWYSGNSGSEAIEAAMKPVTACIIVIKKEKK